MSAPGSRLLLLLALLLLVVAPELRADPPVPGNILEPKTAAEAWNVIRLATANAERLMHEKRLSEMPVQVSFCSPSLRALVRFSTVPETDGLSKKALAWVVEVARAAAEGNGPGTAEAVDKLHVVLTQMAKGFDDKTVQAEIYLCPMHPSFLSPKADARCDLCGMGLVKRRIPYSFLYMTPGEPTVHLTATVNGAVEAGRKVEVKLRLARGDSSAVLPADLMMMHTQPIHLLIETPALDDYHHEHPVTTGTPGEYAFSFLPAKTSPYRVWADIVPNETGTQELPFVDLPSTGTPGPVMNRASTFTSKAGGLSFELTLSKGNQTPPQANLPCAMNVTIHGPDGQPATHLEPVMNAFAHLVGFYDDYHTVVHVHPGGGDVLVPDARGGPTLGFVFFPPRPGFVRFYCQVMVKGEMIFAPFNMNVQP